MKHVASTEGEGNASNISSENMRKRVYLEDTGTDGRIILK
jgi:hypothetical protein